jgi:hypothetical protein
MYSSQENLRKFGAEMSLTNGEATLLSEAGILLRAIVAEIAFYVLDNLERMQSNEISL